MIILYGTAQVSDVLCQTSSFRYMIDTHNRLAANVRRVAASLCNGSLSVSCFNPHELKKWETSPLYKSQDNLGPQNYRLLSVLTFFLQHFERIYNDQVGLYFKHILSTLLLAFRKRYNEEGFFYLSMGDELIKHTRLWNCWVFSLITIWVLMRIFLIYVWRPHGR